MLDLLVGMEAARRLTEESFTYDEAPRGKVRKHRRGPRAVSMLLARFSAGSPGRSRETPSGRHASSQCSPR